MGFLSGKRREGKRRTPRALSLPMFPISPRTGKASSHSIDPPGKTGHGNLGFPQGIGEAPLRAAPLSPRASLRSPGVPRPRRLREPRCPRLRSALRRMLRGMDAPGMRRSGRLVHGCPEGMGQAGLGGHSPPCKVTRGAVLPEGRLSARALRPAASPRRGRRRGPGPGDAQRRRRRGCAACTASAALWAREEEEEKEEGGREREREAGGGREAGGEGALRGSAANFPSAAQQEQPPIPRCVTPAPGEYGKALPSPTPLCSLSSSSPGLFPFHSPLFPAQPGSANPGGHRSSRPSPAAEGLRHCSPRHQGTASTPALLPRTMEKLQQLWRTLNVCVLFL
ncbi:uncharacterized protein LOC143693627 [Agelaius phoeniceus]|uniref:uncharacterized protein LOC143693627 n=1 Tax=Agelaius phoeniceus TaxID=39638 RepID=UPI004054EC7B